MARAGEVVLRAGRRPLAWAEGAGPALPSSFTVMAWRDEAHGLAAARRGQDVVMAPHLTTYLDYAEYPENTDRPGEPPAQPGHSIPLRAVQAYDPDVHDRVLGTQAQLWTEYLPTPHLIEYRAFPRLAALAESAWSGPAPWHDFHHRLTHHRARLDALGVPQSPTRR
ncbi:family 20 glycosylhydrolase [Streptomyces sp. NPDC058579]|uniref:family 20 glycosylhydrolase n=1 Tax=Streptomyces sp. NPDC058579 TaxID=3346548 RepID=UPI003658BA89